ncbi:hypothetical protein KY289_023289 [Solanum tuberosum]|nr:hypothetical protein KY289_023289 [Solanum tuberosum]
MEQVTGDDGESGGDQHASIFVLGRQLFVAMLMLDTWQYFMHRYMHQNKFLYKHIHAQHHRLIVPYAFGALYNHPLEGLILDTIGRALAFLVSGMSPRTSIFFFSFATIKPVDDHCGLWLPGNLLHIFFKTTPLTMISIASFMGPSITIHSLSLRRGIGYLVLTCHMNLRGDRKEVLKLSLLKIARNIDNTVNMFVIEYVPLQFLSSSNA